MDIRVTCNCICIHDTPHWLKLYSEPYKLFFKMFLIAQDSGQNGQKIHWKIKVERLLEQVTCMEEETKLHWFTNQN